MIDYQSLDPGEPRYATKMAIVIALVLGVILLLWVARGVLAPVIFGALLAYMLAPLVRWLEGRMPRRLGILVAYLLVVAAGVLIFVVLPVAFFSSLSEIDFSALFDKIDLAAIRFLEAISTITIFGTTFDLSSVTDSLIVAISSTSPAASPETVASFLFSAFAATAGLFGVVVSLISFFVFTMLIAVSLSASGGRMVRGGLTIFPSGQQTEVHAIGTRVREVWHNYVRGELVLVAVIGVLVTLVAMLLGLPGALFLGVIAGALEVIPTFGPFIAAVPAVVIALVNGSVRWDMPNLAFGILVALAYTGVQMIENNLIGPKVLGDALRVQGLVVMIAITVGFQTAGVLGAILAVPIVASARVLTRYAWWKVTGVDLAARATADP
jgi:predicted PurR-regulated permease PerM